jgi:hypothetical protein
MRSPAPPRRISFMADGGELVLRLEIASGREPVTGVVRAPDGAAHEFSGWSELFAVLTKILQTRPAEGD